MSGIAYYQYRYPNSTVSGENQWTTYASSNKSPFTTTAFSRQRNEKVEFRICDNAGLCSAPVSTMIQIDREAIWYVDKDNIVRSDNFNYE